MNTMTVILELMESTKTSQKQLCEFLGVCESKFSDWKKGRIKSYNKHLPKIAEFFDVSLDYLVKGTVGTAAHGRAKQIPMYGKIACGELQLAEQEYEYITVSPQIDADFCLEAKGDSMINARIFPGDIVFIKAQPDVENGEIAAVVMGDDATLKRVYKYPGRIELRAENPLYAPMSFEKEQLNSIRIIGKAVAFQSFIK